MMKKIAVIAGDGIGPEIVGEAVKVLKRVAEAFGHEFCLQGLPGRAGKCG